MGAVHKCVVCGCSVLAPTNSIQICERCRLAAAELILRGDTRELGALWTITRDFEVRRKRALEVSLMPSTPPLTADMLAILAWGLIEQGIKDDALVFAAIAIQRQKACPDRRDAAIETIFHRDLAPRDLAGKLRSSILPP